MTDPSSDDSKERETHPPNRDFRIEIDPKVGQNLQEGLQVGFDAIGQLLSGFVSSIKDSIAPEVMKNLTAGQWLAQVATGLDEIASLRKSGQPVPQSKMGELTFYVEQLDTELAGTRVQNLAQSLKDRLGDILKQAEHNEVDDNALQSAIGYFRAASKSSLPQSTH